MKQFFAWLQRDEGWKSILAIVYAAICIFDFILVPIGLNINRREVLNDELLKTLAGVDPAVQLQIVQATYRAYVPFTLQGSGLFHIAFGALLTGSAISKFKEKE